MQEANSLIGTSPFTNTTYNKIICDQLSRGFIEMVYTPEKSGLTHFIPHHCVIKNSITTLIWIRLQLLSNKGSSLPKWLFTHRSLISAQTSFDFVLISMPSQLILRKPFSISTSIRVIETTPASDATDTNSELIMYRFKTVYSSEW